LLEWRLKGAWAPARLLPGDAPVEV